MAILENINSTEDVKKLNYDNLTQLAAEIRSFLVDNVSKTGGHLASNLGIVELTLALHKVFNSPNDSIVYDVGHQSYVHKILTGRKDAFKTLRQHGGLSGFPKVSESEHDTFNSGHASNSISVALGFAEANRLLQKNNHAIAVLGDGALTGGLSYEALNNAGRSKANLIVILNDNEMSISPNVGSMTNYLTKLRTGKKYTNMKRSVKAKLIKNKVGKKVYGFLDRAKDGVRRLLLAPTLFEELGFTYVGPIDGHNIQNLCTVFERAKDLNKPVFIHLYTQKGRGYPFAEQAPHLYHGTGPFDVTKPVQASKSETFSSVCGKTLLSLGEQKKNLVAVSAAMADATGLLPFANQYPERFFDVGISEAHAVTFSAGLAAKGYFPAVCIYSTFMQRAYDSILHDMALQPHVSALLCLDRAGLVGADGETHHGIFDISYLSHIPNVEIFTPYTAEGMEQAIKLAVTEQKKVYAVRYPRGGTVHGETVSDIYAPEQLRKGEKVTVVTCSRMTSVVKEVPFDGDHFHLNCIKPIKFDEIIKSLEKTGKLVTVEDNMIKGGMGMLLAEELVKAGFTAYGHLPLGIDDTFVTHGSVDELLCDLKLDAKSLETRIEEFIK
ncbi:MAG: 1-deoxy-D-xylulose-5-phosphate synthase [Clostridia bacterium]|nr:1-deoxy-D-xylulose-5-phosphate synthase [Clostridia bacterium]